MPTGRDDDATAILTPLRSLPTGSHARPGARGEGASRAPSQGTVVSTGQEDGSDEPVMWFVTVTLAGPPAPTASVRRALERLSAERPFVVSARYGTDRAEVRYWDESDEVRVAVRQALRMWSDHLGTARLPHWKVVGLEVIDRATARRRWDKVGEPQVFALGEIRPLGDDD